MNNDKDNKDRYIRQWVLKKLTFLNYATLGLFFVSVLMLVLDGNGITLMEDVRTVLIGLVGASSAKLTGESTQLLAMIRKHNRREVKHTKEEEIEKD